MTDRELKRLTRKDLLELLVSQGHEQEELKAELEKAKAELQERQLLIQEAGSLAEAALRLNGVFEAAEAAAQQYLENIRRRSQDAEELCSCREAVCTRQEEEMRKKMDFFRKAAKTAGEIEEKINEKCQIKVQTEVQAEEKAEAQTEIQAEVQTEVQEGPETWDWTELLEQLGAFRREYETLEGLLDSGGGE